MEIAVCERRAIGGDEQVGAVEIRRAHGHQLDLQRPRRDFGRARRTVGRRRRGMLDRLRARAGASGRLTSRTQHLHARTGATTGRSNRRRDLRLVRQHGGLIVSSCFALHKRDGARGARRQAIAQAIAVIVAHKARLAIHQADSALVARLHADAASVARSFIDMDNTSNHGNPRCLCAPGRYLSCTMPNAIQSLP